MKKLLILSGFLFLISYWVSAQKQSVIVHPQNSYVKENLDLNAVALIYEESANIEDFQQKLNYPQDRISNLDLNNDNKVDFLRVSEKIINNIKIILIQSEVDTNIYEDVASINIILNSQKTSSSTTSYKKNSGIQATQIIVPVMLTFLDILLWRF